MRTGMSRVPMLIPAQTWVMLLQTRSTTNNRVSRQVGERKEALVAEYITYLQSEQVDDMECSALCRECHSLLTVSLFVSRLYTCVRKPKEVGSPSPSSSSFTYYEIQLFDNWGLLPPQRGQVKEASHQVWNFGGDIIIIILASSFNQCMCDTWRPTYLLSVTHTGIPTLDHGKNPEQNLGWLLILKIGVSCSQTKSQVV